MDLADLSILLTVAQELNITRAAERLGYVQSNVTSRIKQLETELNVRLLIRHPRGVRLTSNGEVLADYARRITSLVEEAVMAVSDTGSPSGRLNLGAVETVTAAGLMDMIASYHRRFPDVDLTLATGTSESLIASICAGEIDAGFVTGPIPHENLVSERRWDDELLAVGVTVAGFKSRDPWIVFNRGCSYRAALERWLSSIGFHDARFLVVGTLEAMERSVFLGLGNAVLPKSTVERLHLSKSIQIRSIPDPFGKLSVNLVRCRDGHITSALREFVHLADSSGEDVLL